MSRNNKLKLTAALVSGVFLLGAGLGGCNRGESTATLLAEAKQYQQKGDYKAALIQLKNAAAKSPDDAEARLQLGMLYLETGDAVSADKELRKAASLGMKGERTLPLLGRALRAQGKSKELLEEITPALAQNSAPLLALRGDALLDQNKPAEAQQAYTQALQLQPANGAALIGLARHALAEKDTAQAERYAAEAVTKDPQNPETWLFKGSMLRGADKPDEALAAFDKAIALKPSERTAYIEKAYIEISQGKFDAARADIAAARKNAPESLLVTYVQALLDYSQGKHAQALESLQKVLKGAPEHMPSILLAGAVELNLGSNRQAEQHLRKYLESHPENVYARKLLAQTLLNNAQPADAAATLAPALKEASDDPQLLALAGQSYMQVRNFDKATAYFEKASALAPKVAAIHTSLGLSRLGQGEQAKAIQDLEQGAALDPKSAAGGMALIQAELSMKHYDKALAAAQALAKHQPDNPQVHTALGGVYLAKAEPAKARASFEKALELDPTWFPAVGNLAQLDLNEKKLDAAKGRFNTLLQKDPKHIGAMSALADIAMSEDKPNDATKWLEKASNDNPEAVAPAIRLASHYLRIKQNQKALTLARKFNAANPNHPDLLDLLGQTQLVNNDAPGALETYSKLVNVLPKSALAQYRLASTHMALKNENAAADDLKHALALQPDFVPAQLAQAELAMRRNRPEEALAAARALQKQPANTAVGYMLEGDVLAQQRKPAQALPLYEKAFALQQSPKLMITIHRVMEQSGKEAQADARLATWLKEHPTDVQTAMYAAERSLGKRQYKEASAQFQSILKIAPDNPAALNNLAWAYQQLKDARALETAEAAYRLSGDNPSIMDTLGAILTEHGDTKRALPLLQKGLALAPDNLDLRLHLAEALAKSGDKAGARKELEQFLAKGQDAPGAEQARALLKQL